MGLSFEDADRRKFAQVLMAAQPSATELRQLAVRWRRKQWGGGGGDADAMTAVMFLTWLIAHAKNLRVLHLSIYMVMPLPPMPQLRHFIMFHHTLNYTATLQDLSLLANLQTLMLGNVACRDVDAEVLLAGMCHLRHVHLDGVVPSRLELPHQASLHVTLYEVLDLYHPVWVTVLPMLRTVRCSSEDDLLQLPDFLNAPSGLTHALFDVNNAGSSEKPLRLREAFMSSVVVHISCHDAHVDVWGGRWKHLCINATNDLVDCGADEKLVPFFCPDFYLEYSMDSARARSLCTYPWLAMYGYAQLFNPHKACMWKGPRNSQPVSFDDHACSCGACIECLQRSGEMSF